MKYVVRVAVGDYMGDDVIVDAGSPEDAKAEAEELVKSWPVEALSVREADAAELAGDAARRTGYHYGDDPPGMFT